MKLIHKVNSFETAVCPVCNSDEFNKLFKITYFNDDILPKIGVNNTSPTYLNVCAKCEHHFASPRLSDEALDIYYSTVNTEYYTNTADGKLSNKLLKQHKNIVNLVEKYKTNGSILEIGCGYGYLLDIFQKRNWKTVGVEPFGIACKFAQEQFKLNIVHGYLDKDTFPESQKFDVIMLFDVMEHLKNALLMKDIIDYYLKPGGLLVIGTGNISSFNAKISQEKWAYLSLREHVSFFSKSSMTTWLRPYNILEFKPVSYSGTMFGNVQTLLTNLFIRRLYNMIQRLHYPITKWTLTRFPFVRYMLAFDHMVVIARKNS